MRHVELVSLGHICGRSSVYPRNVKCVERKPSGWDSIARYAAHTHTQNAFALTPRVSPPTSTFRRKRE